ncbi:MAG: hypothetical protein L0Y35_02355 [Flammeovirgaceae bacterium]|nr:hypothetical protein [Flammeovirgaceae bacterium]
MSKNQNLFNTNRLQGWFIKITLVLGLITFSGYGAEIRLHQSQATKTELLDSPRIYSKKVVSYKKTGGICSPFLPSILRQPDTRISLLQYARKVNVEFSRNVEECLSFKRPGKHLAVNQSAEKSEEFTADKRRG